MIMTLISIQSYKHNKNKYYDQVVKLYKKLKKYIAIFNYYSYLNILYKKIELIQHNIETTIIYSSIICLFICAVNLYSLRPLICSKMLRR